MIRPFIVAFGTVFGGTGVYAGVMYLFGLSPTEPTKSIAFVTSFVVAATASVLAARPLARSSRPDENLTIAEMEARGLLAREHFEAMRAFQVEESDDEGCQYFIELKDGSVLYLCGQYLYDYEPVLRRKILKQQRQFPCTEFAILRHKESGFVADVVCGGNVLEPETKVPPFTLADFDSGRAPSDGDIISGRSYDQLKREWSKGG